MTADKHSEPGPVEVWHCRLSRWGPATFGRYPHRVFTPRSRYSRVRSYQR